MYVFWSSEGPIECAVMQARHELWTTFVMVSILMEIVEPADIRALGHVVGRILKLDRGTLFDFYWKKFRYDFQKLTHNWHYHPKADSPFFVNDEFENPPDDTYLNVTEKVKVSVITNRPGPSFGTTPISFDIQSVTILSLLAYHLTTEMILNMTQSESVKIFPETIPCIITTHKNCPYTKRYLPRHRRRF